MSTAATVRLELHAKNAILHRLVTANGHTVASFCREHGIMDKGLVGAYIRLRAYPYLRFKNHRGPTTLAQRLSDLAGMLVEDLFPPALYETLVEGPVVGEVSVERFVALSAARHLALPPAQEVQIERGELRSQLVKAMTGLRSIEVRVLRRRFGLHSDDGDGQPLREIAVELGRTPERIRQIEACALRKLRHPRRSKFLRSYLKGRT